MLDPLSFELLYTLLLCMLYFMYLLTLAKIRVMKFLSIIESRLFSWRDQSAYHVCQALRCRNDVELVKDLLFWQRHLRQLRLWNC